MRGEGVTALLYYITIYVNGGDFKAKGNRRACVYNQKMIPPTILTYFNNVASCHAVFWMTAGKD